MGSRRRRGASKFRQRDLTRAVKAITKAGVKVASIELAVDGKIVILTGMGTAPNQPSTANEWDDAS
jgi:hypothetical protein